MSEQEAKMTHPDWCNRLHSAASEHISDEITVDGEIPLVVEVFQDVGEATTHVSILERDGGGFVRMSAAQVGALAGALGRVALPAR
jgi:hypothetical protein